MRKLTIDAPKVAWLSLAAMCVTGRALAGTPQQHHHIDERELRQLQRSSPESVKLLTDGESLLRDGDGAAAAERFEAAWKLSPESVLIGRRTCQALTVIGKRREAMKACETVMDKSGVPLNATAFVRATMSGPEAPTTSELEEAYYFALMAKRKLKAEPWGYAAECDILARIGDEKSQRKCVDELAKVAPLHYETKRARARLPAPESRAGMTAGWLGLLLAGVGTLVHALWTFFERQKQKAPAALFACALGLSANSAAAAEPAAEKAPEQVRPLAITRYPIDEQDPVKGVPTPQQRDADPVEFGNWLMEITGRAAEAERDKNRPRAIRYYTAAAKAVPDRAITFSKLCGLYEAEGNEPAALNSCRAALVLPGVSLADYERFGRLVVRSKANLTPDDRAYLKEVLAHLRKQGDREIQLADSLECPFAARTQDEQALERCVARLKKLHPKGNNEVVAYEWALAMARSDFGEADQLVERAKGFKAKPAAIANMAAATAEARRAYFMGMLWNWKTGVVLLGLLAAVAAAILIRSRRRPTPPTSAPGGPAASAGLGDKPVPG